MPACAELDPGERFEVVAASVRGTTGPALAISAEYVGCGQDAFEACWDRSFRDGVATIQLARRRSGGNCEQLVATDVLIDLAVIHAEVAPRIIATTQVPVAVVGGTTLDAPLGERANQATTTLFVDPLPPSVPVTIEAGEPGAGAVTIVAEPNDGKTPAWKYLLGETQGYTAMVRMQPGSYALSASAPGTKRAGAFPDLCRFEAGARLEVSDGESLRVSMRLYDDSGKTDPCFDGAAPAQTSPDCVKEGSALLSIAVHEDERAGDVWLCLTDLAGSQRALYLRPGEQYSEVIAAGPVDVRVAHESRGGCAWDSPDRRLPLPAGKQTSLAIDPVTLELEPGEVVDVAACQP